MKTAFWLWPPGWASGHDNYQSTLLEGLLSQSRHPITVVSAVPLDIPAGTPHALRLVEYPTRRRWTTRWEDRVSEVAGAAVHASEARCVIGCAHFPLPRLPEIPLVATAYESDFGVGLPWHIIGARWIFENNRSLSRAAHHAHTIAAISQYTARALVEDLGVPREKVIVSEPAVRDFGSMAPERYMSAAYVVVVGWLHPREGIRFAIRSWARSREQGLAHRLVLVGRAAATDFVEGDLARMVIDEAGPYASDVRWTGLIPRSEYGRVLRDADALLVTSLQEGFGIPVIEAASLGTPTVATARGALADVAPPVGEVVSRDVVAVSDALSRAVKRPPDRHALTAYAARFTVEAQAAPIIQTLDQLEKRN